MLTSRDSFSPIGDPFLQDRITVMTPAIPAAELRLTTFIACPFGGILLPTHLCQAFPQPIR